MTKWDLFWEFKVNLIYENQAVTPDVSSSKLSLSLRRVTLDDHDTETSLG